MIKYDNNTINKLATDATVNKMYYGSNVAYMRYYRLVPQNPCYDVIDSISSYTARTFSDVYDTSSNKWYKLNNADAYEEYGIYADTTASTETTYDGKLAKVGNYEYEFINGQWVNIGEATAITTTEWVDFQTLDFTRSYPSFRTVRINRNNSDSFDSISISNTPNTTSYSTDNSFLVSSSLWFGKINGVYLYYSAATEVGDGIYEYNLGKNYYFSGSDYYMNRYKTNTAFTNDAGYLTEHQPIKTINGNVLTPSDTVYYNMALYNSCNASSNSYNLTFPMSVTVKVGGSFSFFTSNYKYYIYGYQAPALGTRYYVDNYQDTFDIVYTKLNDEAVTITYTTYDPSDTEVPAFKTDITYPYSGGTTSSTTLTSFDVPYTYPYKVSQTSDKFSADSQTYTAGQASRTISFTLYPNNRDFATVADMEAYAYAWEGMRAYIGSYKYVYQNGEWVEKTYTQYEYIRTQNASTIYYDFITNFKPTNNHTLEIKVEFVDRPIDWGHILSWYDGSSSSSQFEFQTVTSGYRAIIRTGGNNGVSYRPTIGANKPTVFTLPLSAQSGTYSVNGGSSQTIQYNYSTMTLPANIGMCFFGRGTTSRQKAAVVKMYYVKVYDGNGNLVKHYVPSDNNGTPCFYEIVDGDYIMDTYTGSNHGTLTLGPEV